MLSLSRRLPHESSLRTCIGAVGFFTASAVHMCSHNGASDSARTITCTWTGADRRVCMLATRDVLLGEWLSLLGSTRTRIVSSLKAALAEKKKNGPYKYQV